jgi:hypothetical protein
MKAPDWFSPHLRAPRADGPAIARPSTWRLTACTSLVALTMVAACTTAPPAQPVPSNESLPVPLQVGSDEALQETLTASGVQTYVCRRTAEGLTWRAEGAEASLFDATHDEVGAIVPGEYFTAHDDSIFAGRVAAEAEMAPVTLPWQRIAKRYTAGSPESDGRLSHVTSIQRVLTAGGIPLGSRCGIDGLSLAVPYGATYLLYRHVDLEPTPSNDDDVSSMPVPVPVLTTTPDR